ncbi:ABC transporter transmembrane region 2-domain-containing protein [Jimgerdemannia flammicorona]|uniref:ABC transporter transmembrane region 2-domain-containing protein n=2 Tax=Jimgerdemannia flammicorona TaxID=994334 RepID=A0A433QGF7_9FUNG|nr:ABC transporter transmembrane region 2-domain-containing protein [Jimgerdemannia flammicorona]RUS28887.1 ABC transporter transmembrane region 2-domain-containing protein [Jimgerdemannia flammicorona]
MQTFSKPISDRLPSIQKILKDPLHYKTPIIASAALLSLSVAVVNHVITRPRVARRKSAHTRANQQILEEHKKFFTPVDPTRKVGVNGEFLRQIRAILLIIIPNIRSKEVFILLLHSVFLVLRTWLSVVVAKLDGQIVRDLVAANGKSFLRGIGYWFAIAIPATYTNSMVGISSRSLIFASLRSPNLAPTLSNPLKT